VIGDHDDLSTGTGIPETIALATTDIVIATEIADHIVRAHATQTVVAQDHQGVTAEGGQVDEIATTHIDRGTAIAM
jgi:hypothetical protein